MHTLKFIPDNVDILEMAQRAPPPIRTRFWPPNTHTYSPLQSVSHMRRQGSAIFSIRFNIVVVLL